MGWLESMTWLESDSSRNFDDLWLDSDLKGNDLWLDLDLRADDLWLDSDLRVMTWLEISSHKSFKSCTHVKIKNVGHDKNKKKNNYFYNIISVLIIFLCFVMRLWTSEDLKFPLHDLAWTRGKWLVTWLGLETNDLWLDSDLRGNDLWLDSDLRGDDLWLDSDLRGDDLWLDLDLRVHDLCPSLEVTPFYFHTICLRNAENIKQPFVFSL